MYNIQNIILISIQHISEENPQLLTIKQLFGEYLTELNEDLCFQHFDEELDNPLLKYGPPKGCLLLALWKGETAGCVALQPIDQPGVCEMKRLYVKPAFRKHGIGDELVKQILANAISLGYKKIVLDTLSRLVPAINLYEKYGFVHTSAYYDNPLQKVVYMEKGI